MKRRTKVFAIIVRNGAFDVWGGGWVGAIEVPGAAKLRAVLESVGAWPSKYPDADGSEVWHCRARYKDFRRLQAAGFVMSGHEGSPLRFPGRDGWDWICLSKAALEVA